MLPKFIETSIFHFLQKQGTVLQPAIYSAAAVIGGSINRAHHLKTSHGEFFVKYNDASSFPGMFQKEAKGLKLLAEAGAIKVPEVLMVAEDDNHAFLLLNFINAAAEKDDFWDDFGEKLAKLHKVKSEQFGLEHNNYMGSLQQFNTFHDTWVEFFIVERLERQIILARENGRISKNDVQAFERLFNRLEEIFPPTLPSLLHGDLWSGNFIVGATGHACLIDPAVYYGHPEIDIAMTNLFGGFSNRFYEAYNRHNPLEKGWRDRLPIYNLYPLLVHVNLFGGSYLGSVKEVLRRF